MLTKEQIDEWKPSVIHRPLMSAVNVDMVAKMYADKDGVPVKYVCTSAINGGTRALDIYYRDTPHPEFGNRYFGLYHSSGGQLMISNADAIDGMEFGMIKDSGGQYHYSQHRHDYVAVDGKVIDGGRAYVRGNGVDVFRLVDGVFV